MTYTVKEIFYTLQGEGAQAGRPAVFCRMSGCNFWNGLEKDRESSFCPFCDTDFIGTGPDGGKFKTARDLALKIQSHWPNTEGKPLVVITGGEPLLQLDAELIDALHSVNFEIAIETNGSMVAPANIDWICVSPKAGAPWVQTTGNELKLLYPQAGLLPHELPDNLNFEHYFLQAIDTHLMQTPPSTNTLNDAIAYCLAHPKWRLSLQTHKITFVR